MKTNKVIITVAVLLMALFIGLGANVDKYGAESPWILDQDGNKVFKVDANGNLKVIRQDQITPMVDLFFIKTLAFNTTAATAAYNAYSIELADATSFSVGNTVGLFASGATDRYYFGTILSKSVDTLTLDTPFDFAYPSGSNILAGERNLAISDGSTTPVVYSIQGGGGASDISIDITRINIAMTTTATPELDDFGDITDGLVRGIVLRHNNGQALNVWNIKDNYEIGQWSGFPDLEIFTASGSGIDGVGARISFNGDSEHGVPIRLDPGDMLELIVQDDLTDLVELTLFAQGHVVDPS